MLIRSIYTFLILNHILAATECAISPRLAISIRAVSLKVGQPCVLHAKCIQLQTSDSLITRAQCTTPDPALVPVPARNQTVAVA